MSLLTPVTASFFMGYLMLNIGLEAAAWTTVGCFVLFRYGPGLMARGRF